MLRALVGVLHVWLQRGRPAVLPGVAHGVGEWRRRVALARERQAASASALGQRQSREECSLSRPDSSFIILSITTSAGASVVTRRAGSYSERL